MIIYNVKINPKKKWLNSHTGGANFLTENKFIQFIRRVFKIKENCKIEIYLGEFNYRKNVSYKRVARDINDFFLIELFCVMSRGMTKNRKAICGVGNDNHGKCPISNVWNEVRLKI